MTSGGNSLYVRTAVGIVNTVNSMATSTSRSKRGGASAEQGILRITATRSRSTVLKYCNAALVGVNGLDARPNSDCES